MVQWHVPKRKRPIAYSTKATSDIITTLMGNLTIKELRERITYDVEVKQVLDEYIKRGFGDWLCREHFQKWDRRHAYIHEDKRGFIEVERGEDEITD